MCPDRDELELTLRNAELVLASLHVLASEQALLGAGFSDLQRMGSRAFRWG